MRNCKKILLPVIIVLAIAWCFRYYQLNDGKLVTHKYPEVRYGVNDKVEYGDGLVEGKEKSPGYAITLLDKRIVDCKDYLHEIKKTKDDFEINLPEKVLEITVDISNISNTNSEDGVDFYPIWLIGRNWYEVYSSEFTAYANEIYKDDTEQAFGIQVKQGKNCIMKIVYPISRADFSYSTWNHMDKEPMWLTITYRPQRQLICVQ